MTQTASSNNPLAKHFRQPSIYIKLTSGGKYWKDGTVELPMTGEIPVYPMTAKDEIILRTPDALINGTSVVNVVQSCCPNIKNAWAMPSIDVDSTLIAIRIASYGPTMAITAKCPKCNEEHDYDIDLHTILAGIRAPDYNQTISTDDGLVIKFKPLDYYEVSKSGNMVFEEEKLIQALADPSLDEEVRKVEFEKHIKNMIDINVNNATLATESILSDGILITDTSFISDYYRNTKSKVLHQVQAQLKEFAKAVAIKEEETKCASCEHIFKLAVSFDYTHFFDNGF